MAHTSHHGPADLNILRRGRTYTADWHGETVTGEYLGVEAPHGEWSILLRTGAGTHSIVLDSVTSLEPVC